jgi:hypothetical protein
LAVPLKPRNFQDLPRVLVERATGIEPALSAWEADVMPFHYTRV